MPTLLIPIFLLCPAILELNAENMQLHLLLSISAYFLELLPLEKAVKKI